MVASTPQPPSGGMVGKKELLQWASQASGRIVTKFDELKDGDVLLRCMKETWPAAYDRCRRKGQPRSVSGNFELMGNMFDHLELPKSVLDTRGIQHASFKSCYNFLVMAFFLKNLATHSDFSVDFTHPVDSKLAAFLQAPESVASLHKGGALAPQEEEAPRKRPRERRRPPPDPGATLPPESGRPPRAATATTRWSRRPPRRSGPRPRSRTRRPIAAPCSPPRPPPRVVEGRATAGPGRRPLARCRERRERRAAARAAARVDDPREIRAAAGEGRAQEAGVASDGYEPRRRAGEPKASGSSRRLDSLLGRGGTGGGGGGGPRSSSRRRPRIDGSSSDYGTSDGDMAPGGPPETNAAPRGLTRGAVAEICRGRRRPGGVDPATAGFADGGVRSAGTTNTPRSPPRSSPFRSVVAAGSNPASPQTLQTGARAPIVRAAAAAARPRPRRLRSALGQRRRRRPRGDAAGGGALRAGAAARLLDASRRERDLLERRFDAELEAREGEVHRVDARRRGRRAREDRRARASARRRTQRGSARVPPRAAAGGRGGGGGEDRRRRADCRARRGRR